MKNKMKNGFTLVEILVISPIVILTIGIFITTIISMTGDILVSRTSDVLSYEIQSAMERIETDVKQSGGFLSTNNVSIFSPQGYDNNVSNFYNINADPSIQPMLILNSYATKDNPDNGLDLVYLDSTPNACNSSNLSSNSLMTYNIVYFVKDGGLWRRTLMPANYQTIGCIDGSIGAPWQKPSCVTEDYGAFCKLNDERVISQVVQSISLDLKYYETPSSITDIADAIDSSASDEIRQAALSYASTVGVTLEVSTKTSKKTLSQSDTQRFSSTIRL